MSTLHCPACDLPMDEGYIPERGKAHHHFASWVEGPPDPTWYGTAKVVGRARYILTAYRCSQCGKVEFFAVRPYEQLSG